MSLLSQLSSFQPLQFAGGNVTLTPIIDPITLDSYKKGKPAKLTVQSGYLLKSPRNNRFTDELKSLVPWYAMRWDGNRLVWWIDTPYITAVVLDVIADFFDPALAGELDSLRKSSKAIELVAVIE